MLENVKINASLQAKIASGVLNAADYFVLALADKVAAAFPAANVYTSSIQQGVKLPACFINIYNITSQRELGGAVALEFQSDVTYLPADELARDELISACVTLLDVPDKISTDVGVYELKGCSAKQQDGQSQMMFRTEAVLKAPKTDDLMQNLEQGVDL